MSYRYGEPVVNDPKVDTIYLSDRFRHSFSNGIFTDEELHDNDSILAIFSYFETDLLTCFSNHVHL